MTRDRMTSSPEPLPAGRERAVTPGSVIPAVVAGYVRDSA